MTDQPTTAPPVPKNADELADLLESGLQGPQLSQVLDAVETRHGSLRASQMIDSAVAAVTQERNMAQALTDLESALTRAADQLTRAESALHRLTDGDAWHAEYANGTIGRDIAEFLTDAARSVRATIALNQAMQDRL